MNLLKDKEGKLDVGQGHSLYWASYGDPKDPAVLLIHGIGGHIFHPDQLTCFDGLKLRVIEVHQRGVGLSTPFGETVHNTVRDNIKDIETLRTHLCVDQWSILSWSYGATLMAGYAMEHPEHCDRLIAYAPYLGVEEDYEGFNTMQDPEAVRRYYAYHNATDAKGLAKSAFNKAADPAQRFEDYYMDCLVSGETRTREDVLKSKTPAEWEKIFQMRRVSSSLEYELQVRHERLLETMARAAGKTVTTPAALVYGTGDAWASPNSYADTIFPVKTVETVPGATHNVYEAPVQKVLHNILKR